MEFESISFNNIINELNKIIDIKEEYIKKNEISEFNDLFSDRIDRMAFYYILIKYIYKHPFFIYQNTFLNETRKKIVNLIEANLKDLYTQLIGIEDGNLKIKVEYVLGYFCDYQYYYNKSKSIYEKDNDKSNSNFKSNPFSNPNFKEALSSNKTFDMKYDINVDINDLAFRVLIKSTFKFHIKRKGQEADIEYDEIEIGDIGDKKTRDEIENYSSNNKKIKGKYIKFVERLKEIENEMKKEIKNENLKIILEFSNQLTNISENDIDKIDIKCSYKAENYKSSEPFIDLNILGDWKKEGLSFFIYNLN